MLKSSASKCMSWDTRCSCYAAVRRVLRMETELSERRERAYEHIGNEKGILLITPDLITDFFFPLNPSRPVSCNLSEISLCKIRTISTFSPLLTRLKQRCLKKEINQNQSHYFEYLFLLFHQVYLDQVYYAVVMSSYGFPRFFRYY